jgi:hypothetical protein
MDRSEKELVIQRLQTMPSNMRLMLGGEGKLSKEDLIKAVEDETEVGELVVEVYMHGLRSFKAAAGV